MTLYVKSPVKRGSWKLHNYLAQKAWEGWSWPRAQAGNWCALLMAGSRFRAQMMRSLRQGLALMNEVALSQ